MKSFHHVGSLLIGALLAISISTISVAKNKKEKETPKPDVTYEECDIRTKAVAAAYYKEHPVDPEHTGIPETDSDYLFDAYVRSVKHDSTGCYEWKDPAAAARMHKSLKEYVIDGMTPALRKKLATLFRALEKVGFRPGIASGYRDEYRQSLITSGVRAKVGQSFHNGSRSNTSKRGWGLGQAADIVNNSPEGFAEEDRKILNEMMWRYIDEHPELGVGRPYGAGDPGHMALIGGEECDMHTCQRGDGKAKKFLENAKKKMNEIYQKFSKKPPLIERDEQGEPHLLPDPDKKVESPPVEKTFVKPEEKKIENPPEKRKKVYRKRHRKHQKQEDARTPEAPQVQTY